MIAGNNVDYCFMFCSFEALGSLISGVAHYSSSASWVSTEETGSKSTNNRVESVKYMYSGSFVV